MVVNSYQDLEVWQKAMDLVVECYGIANKWPATEIYGLCSQLRRAAVSVPANIAEGHGRESTKEYVHHLSIAYGSLWKRRPTCRSRNVFAILIQRVPICCLSIPPKSAGCSMANGSSKT